MPLTVRETSPEDLGLIKDIHRAAFGQEDEAELTAALLADPSAQPALSLLALIGDRGVGHILFTKVKVAGSLDRVEAQILCPLAVRPETQRQGVGRALIEAGAATLAQRCVGLICVLGDPAYYGKFGFQPATALGLIAPYPPPAEYPDAWQVLFLHGVNPARCQGQVSCADVLMRPEFW